MKAVVFAQDHSTIGPVLRAQSPSGRLLSGVGRLTPAASTLTLVGRDVVQIEPERKGQLDDYAQRNGQNIADALDEALAAYLEWERTDYWEAVEGVQRGHEEVSAGRTRPAAEFLTEMRRKYGISGLDNAGIGTRR